MANKKGKSAEHFTILYTYKIQWDFVGLDNVIIITPFGRVFVVCDLFSRWFSIAIIKSSSNRRKTTKHKNIHVMPTKRF